MKSARLQIVNIKLHVCYRRQKRFGDLGATAAHANHRRVSEECCADDFHIRVVDRHGKLDECVGNTVTWGVKESAHEAEAVIGTIVDRLDHDIACNRHITNGHVGDIRYRLVARRERVARNQ